MNFILLAMSSEFQNVCKSNGNPSITRETAHPIVWWLAIVENGIQQESETESEGKIVAPVGNLWVYFLPANTEGLLWSRSKSFSCEPEEALINKFVSLPSDDIPHSQPSMSGSLEHRALSIEHWALSAVPFNKGTMFLDKYCCPTADRAHLSALIVVTTPQAIQWSGCSF